MAMGTAGGIGAGLGELNRDLTNLAQLKKHDEELALRERQFGEVQRHTAVLEQAASEMQKMQKTRLEMDQTMQAEQLKGLEQQRKGQEFELEQKKKAVKEYETPMISEALAFKDTYDIQGKLEQYDEILGRAGMDKQVTKLPDGTRVYSQKAIDTIKKTIQSNLELGAAHNQQLLLHTQGEIAELQKKSAELSETGGALSDKDASKLTALTDRLKGYYELSEKYQVELAKQKAIKDREAFKQSMINEREVFKQSQANQRVERTGELRNKGLMDVKKFEAKRKEQNPTLSVVMGGIAQAYSDAVEEGDEETAETYLGIMKKINATKKDDMNEILQALGLTPAKGGTPKGSKEGGTELTYNPATGKLE